MTEEFSHSTTMQTRERQHTPPLWDVVLYNDDTTPMDFVVLILVLVFEYSKKDAIAKMLAIHHGTAEIVGTYPKSVAEYKAEQVEENKRTFNVTEFRVELKQHDV